MWLLAFPLAAALLMIWAGVRGWRGHGSPADIQFDRRPCPTCQTPSRRGTACIECETWVGR